MTRLICFMALNLFLTPALAASQPEGFCYSQAVKFKNLMHKAVMVDLDSSVKAGEESLVYSPDRYALDNLEEVYKFTVPVSGSAGVSTNFVYSVTIEVWLNTDGKARICDVLEFSHSKSL